LTVASGAGEVVEVTGLDEEQGEMGLEEPGPVDEGEGSVEPGHTPRAAERPLQAQGRQLAEAKRAVGGDRIANSQTVAKCLRVVIGKLVGDREGPHLEGVEDDVAGAAAGGENGDCERRRGDRRGGGEHRDPQPLASKRHRDRRGYHRHGAQPDESRLAGTGTMRKADRRQGGREYKSPIALPGGGGPLSRLPTRLESRPP